MSLLIAEETKKTNVNCKKNQEEHQKERKQTKKNFKRNHKELQEKHVLLRFFWFFFKFFMAVLFDVFLAKKNQCAQGLSSKNNSVKFR